jgi:hypothetical protein
MPEMDLILPDTPAPLRRSFAAKLENSIHDFLDILAKDAMIMEAV